MQAVGIYDHWTDIQLATQVEAEQWGQHAVQAYVWRLIGKSLAIEVNAVASNRFICGIGCDQIVAVEENVVTAFTEVGGDDNNRFTVTLNRAYKVCLNHHHCLYKLLNNSC